MESTQPKPHFFYLARCSDGSLYAGTAVNLKERERQHNEGRGGRYTRTRRPATFVYSESFASMSEARKREAAVKSWPKNAKKRWSRVLALKPFRKLGGRHVDRTEDVAKGTRLEGAVGMDGHRSTLSTTGKVVVTTVNADELKALSLKEANHLFATGTRELSHGRAGSDPNRDGGRWDD